MHKFILEIIINGPNSRKTSIFGRLTKNKENMFSCYLRPPALWVSLAQEGTSCMLIVCIADNREVQEISREKSRFFHSFIKVKIVHISFLVLFHLDSLFWINFLPRIVAKQLSHWTLCHANCASNIGSHNFVKEQVSFSKWTFVINIGQQTSKITWWMYIYKYQGNFV